MEYRNVVTPMVSSQPRALVKLIPGEYIRFKGEDHYQICEVIDTKSLRVLNMVSGRQKIVPIEAVQARLDENPSHSTDLANISDKSWEVAAFRFAAIRPLLEQAGGHRADIERRAAELCISFSSLYRWLHRYKKTGTLEGLLPKQPGPRKGAFLLDPLVEQIIQAVLDDYYPAPKQRGVQTVVNEVLKRIEDSQLSRNTIPHPNTIRNRIALITESVFLRKRRHGDKAEVRLTPTPGSYAHADYPLADVQIDHTQADIILVDDEFRKPIGRPWITVAIDIWSRMVCGFYISFDPPSATSIAACVAHSVLPKDAWLLERGIDTIEWPVFGMMDTLHVENGHELYPDTLQHACMRYNINLKYGSVPTLFGDHIDRLLDTLIREVHELPATNTYFSSDRKGFDSDRNAVLSLSEFEKWLTTLICKVYHKRQHSGIHCSPEHKWFSGRLENSYRGYVMPTLASSPQRLILDFLPVFHRSIQNYGVAIEGITYYANELRHWIHSKDPNDKKKKRKFIFRRDPRNISAIWFYEPEAQEYFRIPSANQALPTMSIWEYRKAIEKARQEGMSNIDENAIHRAIDELRSQVDAASATTKKARRQKQRQKIHKKTHVDNPPSTQGVEAKDTSKLNNPTTTDMEHALHSLSDNQPVVDDDDIC